MTVFITGLAVLIVADGFVIRNIISPMDVRNPAKFVVTFLMVVTLEMEFSSVMTPTIGKPASDVVLLLKNMSILLYPIVTKSVMIVYILAR